MLVSWCFEPSQPHRVISGLMCVSQLVFLAQLATQCYIRANVCAVSQGYIRATVCAVRVI